MNKLVIIDGSSLLYRAFYAVPPLNASNGQYTNAVYGFTNMLLKLLKDLRPDMVIAAFDKGKKTFRNELFAEYKGTRKATPPEMAEQIPLTHELLAAFGIKLIELAGYEADDIIGTLAAQAAAEGAAVVVVTGDRDALQLIDDRVTVMLTKKGITTLELMDEAAFTVQYELRPKQLIDLKGLMGDASDNIPGVPGVGEKTAGKLLKEYGSVENIYANIENMAANKLREKLAGNRDMAFLSKRLATIDCAAPVEYEPEQYRIEPDMERLKEFCEKYELKSILNKLPQIAALTGQQPLVAERQLADFTYASIDSDELWRAFSERVQDAGRMAVTAMVEGRVPELAVVGVGVSSGGKAYFVAPDSPYLDGVKRLLADERIIKITHDAKIMYETTLSGMVNVFDVMLAAYLLEPTVVDYGIGYLRNHYLDDCAQLPEGSPRAADLAWQAAGCELLYDKLLRRLADQSLLDLYYDIEMPLLEVLAAMELAGIKVDRDKLLLMAGEISGQIDKLLADIYELAGLEFNVNSHKQLGEVLFEKLELPVRKKLKTGYSTDAEVLESLKDYHPLIPKLLEYRTLTKLKSTYLDGLLPLLNPATDRVHTSFNQMITATGRLSSSEPNLQNIPVRTEIGRRIRSLFVPGDDYDQLLSADYSQIELRLLAHMSQDRNFLRAFRHGEDIHTRTAAEVFEVPLEEVTGELRTRAKAVNFGIVYGISDYGLARDLKVSRAKAGKYIESYFAKCPGVKDYIDGSVQRARDNGYVTTLLGRRRYLPDINSSNFNRRSFAERMAMNTPIQGTAADIIKKAMIDARRELRRHDLKSRILLQVHDELLLEVVNEEIAQVTQILKQAMQGAIELSVPLLVDVNSGADWAAVK